MIISQTIIIILVVILIAVSIIKLRLQAHLHGLQKQGRHNVWIDLIDLLGRVATIYLGYYAGSNHIFG